MRTYITGIFNISVLLWILCSIVISIAWLFDSQPDNLQWVWMKLCNIVAITFLFHLLFGGKEE